MSQQEQPRRRQPEAEPIKYGDIFDVSGELAKNSVAPKDAATVQAAESIVLGQTQKGSPAAVMQSAADVNERRGVVSHKTATSVTRNEGVTISEAEIHGQRIITEAVGGQVVGQYTVPVEVNKTKSTSSDKPADRSAVTIGEALEAAGHSARDKPVDEADAAAIQAAELRATGKERITPGGLAAEAQSAASKNAQTARAEEKIKLGDILEDSRMKLLDDNPVTKEDAQRVIAAETRNRPDLTTHPDGVSASVAAAAKLNKDI